MRRIAIASSVLLLGAADPPAPLPSPPLVLSVTPGTGGAPWKMKIENTGDVPVRVAADARLLSLEIDGGDAKKKPIRCVLPDDTRPASDEGRDLVVPGKRSWTVTFDPLYYCFAPKERAALVSGAKVTARFGFARPTQKAKTQTPPFAAAPVGAAVGRYAPAKEIEAAPITLAESLVPLPAPAATEGDTAPVSISLPESLDVGRGVDVSTTVRLTNHSSRNVTTLFRPSTLGFRVSGTFGSVRCGAPSVTVESPIRELFTTIAPKGRAELGVLVAAMCPADTFDEPGIYRIVPRLDTTNASGRKVGLASFDGEVVGQTPLLLRVRNARRESPNNRPKLDDK